MLGMSGLHSTSLSDSELAVALNAVTNEALQRYRL